MCFSIAKLWCLSLREVIGYFFSLFYIHAWYAQNKNMQRITKEKKNQNAFKYGCKHFSRRCGSYRMYLEGDSRYQAVMILCELNWFSYISYRHNIRHLCNLAIFFTHNIQNSLLLLIHEQVQCDLTITRDTCVNVCSLNCLNLFLKYKIS